MVWFWGLLVLVAIFLLCTWVLVFFIDYRSCASIICTSDITGRDGEDGEPGEDAPVNDAGPFGAFSIVTGKRGPRGKSKVGPTGRNSAGGLITGPRGATGGVGPPHNSFDGVFFPNEDFSTSVSGFLTSTNLLSYYEEALVPCPLNFTSNGTEFPTAKLSFTRFGNQVTLGVVIGDIRPQLLFNNKKLDVGIGILQPSYIQFSTAVLNNLARFFVVKSTPWQLKRPVQILFASSVETPDLPPDFQSDVIFPGQLLIRTQLAQILMQVYATPNQNRFCTIHINDLATNPAFYGLFGIQMTFQTSWNLTL